MARAVIEIEPMRRLSVLALCVMGAVSFATTSCNIIKAQPAPKVTTGTLQGVVTGPGGPVSSATVMVTASDATQHAGLSDSGGYYSITGIATGPATYSVRASGYAEVDGSITIAPDPTGNRQDVSLNPL